MKNEQIIETVRADLIEAGRIAQDEMLHTFQFWKQSGYSVKKGEKAICQTRLWKYTNRATASELEDAQENDIDTTGRFFLAKSYLFSSRQVQRSKS